MSKKFVLLIAVAAILVPAVAAAEKIENFNAVLRVQADSSVQVQETIVYNFEGLSRHGIFRTIPYKYNARGGNFSVQITNISVRDSSGAPYRFTVSNSGNNKQIQIGDSKVYVDGTKTYVISYTIGRAINYFSDHDELYWNVTGNGWGVSIGAASATVYLPAAVELSKLQAACFAGALGANSPCANIEVPTGSDSQTAGAEYRQDNLAAGEGLTVVEGFPKGVVQQPLWWQELLRTIADNIILLLPLLVFGLMFYLWQTRGRDPQGRGTIVAQYEPPFSLSPAEVGTIIDERADNQDISADIINLAVRGYIKIARVEKKGMIFDSADHELYLLKNPDDNIAPFEKTLLDKLFAEAGEIDADGSVISQKKVSLSLLKNKFYKDLQEIRKQIYESLVTGGYFTKNPERVRGYYIGAGVILIFACIWLSAVISSFVGAFGVASVIASAIIVAIFGYFMPQRTLRGVEAKEQILGLKEYLNIAEKDRIAFHNAPDKSPERFEKLLPYAMVLGVEKQWAAQFAGIYSQPPSWYAGAPGTNFSSLILISSLGDFRSSAGSALASRPGGGAASGASGFGGGGFSGGGFGGGGGGSW